MSLKMLALKFYSKKSNKNQLQFDACKIESFWEKNDRRVCSSGLEFTKVYCNEWLF